MKRSTWVWACLWASACAAPGVAPGDEEVELDSVEQELSCAPSDLVWTAGSAQVCSGPFSYREGCFERSDLCVARDPNACLEYHSCNVLTGTPTRTQTTNAQVERQCDRNCDEDGRHCGHPICEDNTPDLQVACSERRAVVEAEVRAATLDQFDALITVRSTTNILGTNFQCRISITAPTWAWRSNDAACGCRVQDFVQCQLPASSCRVPGGEHFSAPNMSLTQVVAQTGDTAATCFTGEHIGDPKALFAFMQSQEGRLGEPALQGQASALRTTFTRRYQKLYEVYGAEFDDAARATLRTRAFSGPNADIAPGCGDAVPLPAVGAACPAPASQNYAAARAGLAPCARLAQDGVSAQLTSKELLMCLDQQDALTRLRTTYATDDAPCGGPALRQRAREITLRMFERQAGLIADGSAPPALSSLPRQLALLDSWHTSTRAALVAEGVQKPDAAIELSLSAAFRKVWDAQYARVNPFAAVKQSLNLPSGSDAERTLQRDEVKRAVAELAGTSFLVDQAMIEAAFTTVSSVDGRPLGRTPLRGLPLLLLLGDALTPVAERADDLSVFHDFACTFRQGCGTQIQDTPIARTWQLLAHLDDKAGLDAALVTSLQLSGWRATFGKISGAHGALSSALNAAGVASGTDIASLPSAAQRLVRLMTKARARFASFEASGQLEPTARKELATGLDPGARETIINEVEAGVARLDGALIQYAGGMVGFVGSLMGEVDTQASSQRLLDEKLRLSTRWDNLSKDLAGLRAAADAEEARFGDVVERFKTLGTTLNGGAFYPVGSTARLTFDGASAQGSGGRAFDVRPVAAQVLTGLEKGQLVSMNAGGTYRPSCTLSKVQGMSPLDGSAQRILPATQGGTSREAVAGPEGYSLSWSTSGFVATQTQRTSNTSGTVGASVELCVSEPDFVEFFSGFSLKACAYAKGEHTWGAGSSDSDGSQSNLSANFAGGLRLSRTPFPNLPAGALLFVFANPFNGDVFEAHVVGTGPNAFLVPDAGLEGYFVVNDEGSCDGDDRTQQVTVEAQVLEDAATAARRTLEAMSKVLARMRTLQELTLEQGRVLPSQAALARSEALAMLDAGTNADDCPPQVRRLFDTFVDREVLRTERKVEMLQIEREMRLLELEVEGLDREINFSAQRSHLQALASKWALRGMDGRKLRGETVDMLRMVRAYFLPILELWYPTALDSFSRATELDALLGTAELSDSVPELAKRASTALTTMYGRFRLARPGQKAAGEQLPPVVVSIPNPAFSFRRPFGPSGYNRIQASQWSRVWSAINARTRATITLRPEDLYTENDGGLPCTEHNPVLQKLALYVVRPGQFDAAQLNATPRKFEVKSAAEQVFAQSSGPVTYTMREAAWQRHQVPVSYGEYEEALLNAFEDQDWASQRPVGLSPFHSFEVDFSKITAIDAAGGVISGFDRYASELLIVMQVDSSAVGTQLKWVGTSACMSTDQDEPTPAPEGPGPTPPVTPPESVPGTPGPHKPPPGETPPIIVPPSES